MSSMFKLKTELCSRRYAKFTPGQTETLDVPQQELVKRKSDGDLKPDSQKRLKTENVEREGLERKPDNWVEKDPTMRKRPLEGSYYCCNCGKARPVLENGKCFVCSHYRDRCVECHGR
jgi:hypothetical protein